MRQSIFLPLAPFFLMQNPEPIATESDQLVRAAWLYYIGGNTQEQTAEILGVSRVKVARLLAEAREAGIVKISIEHRFGPMAEVEETIRRHYGLDFCRTTPPLLSDSVEHPAKMLPPAKLADEGPVARRAVAMVAVDLLRERMQVDEECVIGVGWGRTTAEIARSLPAMRRPQAKFVSVMGSLTRNLAANLFEVVHHLAAKTGGEGHFLPVPFIANTVADRQILMSQRIVQETLALAEKANFYLISVGECDERAFLFENRYLLAQELNELRIAGAVGDTMGKFFNAQGEVVSSDLNDRTLAIDLEALRKHEVILLCGGRSKLRPAQGILKTGFVNGLLIDGDPASHMFHEITLSREKSDVRCERKRWESRKLLERAARSAPSHLSLLTVAGCPAATAAARVTINSEPFPGSLLREIVPACASTTAFTRLRPRPRPRCVRLVSPR